ncbi:MAG: hypothetical protein QM719_11530 [Thermomonas sp.]
MRTHRYWILFSLLFMCSSSAQTSGGVCHLFKSNESVRGALVTFVLIGAFPHGFIATSPACPRSNRPINPLSLGQGTRARNFYRQVLFSPSKQSGIWEIQADVDLSPTGLVMKRVHAYRELPEEMAKPFLPKFSPSDEAVIQQAASDAARAADAARSR